MQGNSGKSGTGGGFSFGLHRIGEMKVVSSPDLSLMLNEALTRRIIACFHHVYNELGFGLPEVIYAAALEIRFQESGIEARREASVAVVYHGRTIGTYRLDFLVEDTVIVELKAGGHLNIGSRAQLVTYLRITRKRIGLLLFFGPIPEVQRVVL